MQNLYARIGTVVAVTALAVLVIPVWMMLWSWCFRWLCSSSELNAFRSRLVKPADEMVSNAAIYEELQWGSIIRKFSVVKAQGLTSVCQTA